MPSIVEARINVVVAVPKRVVRTRKDDHRRAREEGEDLLLLDNIPKKRRKVSGSEVPTQSYYSQATLVSPRTQRTAPKKTIDDSETESESESEGGQELLLDQENKQRAASKQHEGGRLPTPKRSPSVIPDPGRAPNRIIGTTYPLQDFKENTARGDLVTKAVEDFAFVIRDIVTKPFASRRTAEMLDCLVALRKTASEVK